MTALSLALLAAAGLGATSDGGTVAVQAGTIHLVEGDVVLEDGTILIQGGKIVAVGNDLELPPSARVIDYGPSAVIVPGFVAAASSLASPAASPRTAEPGLLAIDHFDPYTPYHNALHGGVTTVYLAPARGRLIAGQGAVVKSAGEASADRVVAERTALHGSISDEARRTPGYWEPPVPATVDVGMGFAQRQLPRTTMGAVVALDELLRLAREGDSELEELYGERAGPQLAGLMADGRPWRMGAESVSEVRALLEFFTQNELPLIIEGASRAAELAPEIAKAGFPVIAAPPTVQGADFGKTRDARWPDHGAIAALVDAGVKVAVTCPDSAPVGDLLFFARLARRGGLSADDALRAITINAAEILGVADRVGSLAVGKDADFVVLNGDPFGGASVLTTWSSGDQNWKSRSQESAAVVLEVEELHIGDGETLAPGQVLIQDGEIVQVGRRVSHPAGATVVRGFAAMPGMIDAYGHLGLEGSTKKFSSRVELPRIVEPGDYADRRVAQAGVTTVNLASRSQPGSGSPTMAYKPAGDDFDSMIVADTNAVHMEWTEDIRSASGEKVRKVLEKAQKYADAWDEYEEKMASWKPPVESEDDEDEEADDEDDDKKDKDEEDDDEDEKDDKKSKKRKKKKGDDDAPKIATGVWEGTAQGAQAAGEASRFRMQLLDEEGKLSGNLRCGELSDSLVDIQGSRDEDDKVQLEGFGTRGPVLVQLEFGDEGLSGTASTTGAELTVDVQQASKEYRVARRPERRRAKPEKEPKGKPKEPGIDRDLEPLRQAMGGEATVIVTVHREDEILECIETFEEFGIAPVLFGAERAGRVADQIAGRVRGVLLPRKVRIVEPKKGLLPRNPYAELAAAGIPVAFHSGAEEGAIELPLFAAYAVAQGMSPVAALRALTSDAAEMLSIDDRVGSLRAGLDGDVLLLDGAPLDPATNVLRVWVSGREIR